MSRSRALEVRCAPGKREARANCGPVPQSVRTICRSAPSGRPTVAHSRRRRSLWEHCARVQGLHKDSCKDGHSLSERGDCVMFTLSTPGNTELVEADCEGKTQRINGY